MDTNRCCQHWLVMIYVSGDFKVCNKIKQIKITGQEDSVVEMKVPLKDDEDFKKLGIELDESVPESPSIHVVVMTKDKAKNGLCGLSLYKTNSSGTCLKSILSFADISPVSGGSPARNWHIFPEGQFSHLAGAASNNSNIERQRFYDTAASVNTPFSLPVFVQNMSWRAKCGPRASSW